MEQMTLNLSDQKSSGLDAIVEHAGIHEALTTLRSIVERRGAICPSPVLIHGIQGSGKTTLIKAFLGSVKASANATPNKILLVEPQIDSNRFPLLENLGRVNDGSLFDMELLVIEDIHKISGDDSYSYWNIYNKMNRNNGIMVMTSRFPPSLMFEGNEHLRSRLLSGLVISITPPDDSVKLLILDQMARLRGFRLSHDVITYLLRRKSRNLKELDRIVASLDSESLVLKRRITIPLIRDLEQRGLI